MLLNPVGRADVFVDAFVPRSGPDSVDGLMGIGLSRESNQFCITWKYRLAKPASDTAGDTVAFKTAAPFGRPEFHRRLKA